MFYVKTAHSFLKIQFTIVFKCIPNTNNGASCGHYFFPDIAEKCCFLKEAANSETNTILLFLIYVASFFGLFAVY